MLKTWAIIGLMCLDFLSAGGFLPLALLCIGIYRWVKKGRRQQAELKQLVQTVFPPPMARPVGYLSRQRRFLKVYCHVF